MPDLVALIVLNEVGQNGEYFCISGAAKPCGEGDWEEWDVHTGDC